MTPTRKSIKKDVDRIAREEGHPSLYDPSKCLSGRCWREPVYRHYFAEKDVTLALCEAHAEALARKGLDIRGWRE